MAIIAQYEGILSEVDADGNVIELYPLIKTDEKLKDGGKAADAAEVGRILESLTKTLTEIDQSLVEVSKKLSEVETNLTNLNKVNAIHKGNLVAGNDTITIENESITENSVLTFFTSIYGVNPTAISISEGSVTLTFDVQETDMEVGVRVDG